MVGVVAGVTLGDTLGETVGDTVGETVTLGVELSPPNIPERIVAELFLTNIVEPLLIIGTVCPFSLRSFSFASPALTIACPTELPSIETVKIVLFAKFKSSISTSSSRFPF